VTTAAGSAGICALAGFRVANGAFGSGERVALIALVAASALAGEAGPRTLILLASTERLATYGRHGLTNRTFGRITRVD
jgi:hypothetical protein